MFRPARPLFAVALVALLVAASTVGAEQYTITDLGTLGSGDSYATGINNAGQVPLDFAAAGGRDGRPGLG